MHDDIEHYIKITQKKRMDEGNAVSNIRMFQHNFVYHLVQSANCSRRTEFERHLSVELFYGKIKWITRKLAVGTRYVAIQQ